MPRVPALIVSLAYTNFRRNTIYTILFFLLVPSASLALYDILTLA